MESWARGNLSHRRLRGSSKMPRHKHTDPRYDGGQWLLKGAERPCQPTASSLPERRCLSRKAPGDSGRGVAVLRASPCLATVAGGLNEARLLPRLLAPGQLLASPRKPHSPPLASGDSHRQASSQVWQHESVFRPGAGATWGAGRPGLGAARGRGRPGPGAGGLPLVPGPPRTSPSRS